MKKEKKSVYWTLFRTCFLISCCTFGGGMVIISLLQKKFVEELKWISQDEVMDMVAIAQSCPGVMAVNTSIIIGYHVAGVLGALLTVLGIVTDPTTEGVGDSDRAMTYCAPYCDDAPEDGEGGG